jgi:hypothetical protein
MTSNFCSWPWSVECGVFIPSSRLLSVLPAELHKLPQARQSSICTSTHPRRAFYRCSAPRLPSPAHSLRRHAQVQPLRAVRGEWRPSCREPPQQTHAPGWTGCFQTFPFGLAAPPWLPVGRLLCAAQRSAATAPCSAQQNAQPWFDLLSGCPALCGCDRRTMCLPPPLPATLSASLLTAGRSGTW